MKKGIALIIVFALLMSLASCGVSEPELAAPVQTDPPAEEETLSPREQFEKQKEAMEALQNGETLPPEGQEVPVEPAAQEDPAQEAAQQTEPVTDSVTYTSNGLTYTLDNSFETRTDDPDNFQHVYYNGVMYVTEQKSGNPFGVYTAKELAEKFAAQKETRVVGEANGVYYIEDAALGSITAYYVDDSGFYWMLFATCM